MDPVFEGEPMSWDKVKSILVHLIVPTFVIGTSGAAAMMQRLRANMLDELGKPYVETAIAKGMSPARMLTKYPLRMAFNPFVADIGNLLPAMVSGSVLVSVVLGLQTIGPALLSALKTQDQFLAGFILMFVALLTLIGTMISDLLLMLLDPAHPLRGARRDEHSSRRPLHRRRALRRHRQPLRASNARIMDAPSWRADLAQVPPAQAGADLGPVPAALLPDPAHRRLHRAL